MVAMVVRTRRVGSFIAMQALTVIPLQAGSAAVVDMPEPAPGEEDEDTIGVITLLRAEDALPPFTQDGFEARPDN